MKPKLVARDLGVTVDNNLKTTAHVNNICKAAFLAIRNIGRIRKHPDHVECEKLVHDILCGLPAIELNKLQLVQNEAARLVTRTKKNYHIPPVLRNLHWLPIKERIKLKLLLLTFKALHSQAPIYIIELLHLYTPTRSLRSSSRTTSFPCSFLSREKDPGWERKETGNEVANRNLLIVPKTCTTKTYRPFSIATPNLLT